MSLRIHHKYVILKMIKSLTLRNFFGLGMAIMISQSAFALEGLSTEEANTIVKEDIAAAQVMTEFCPALVGQGSKIESNIQTLIQTYLQDYSDKSMTYAKLQSDSEYQSILQEARTDAKGTDKAEQKSVCDDVINF